MLRTNDDMEAFDQFSSPIVAISALPWVLLFAWVARRLLGARHLSTSTILVSGILGYVAGLGLGWAVSGGPGHPGFAPAAMVLVLVFTMFSIVALELLSRRQQAQPLPRLPAIPNPVRATRLRAQSVMRFVQVARIAARHGLVGMLGIDRPSGAEPLQPGAARWTRLSLEEAGGIFVKLGQLLSTRVDLISLSAAQEFARLQERVPPADPEGVRRVVEKELGRSVDDVFSDFDWDPLAAASLGQVHSAVLRTGERVAVKVQRPGIADVVERDLRIMRRLARMIERRTAWGRAYGVRRIAEEFAARLREELDYRLEAANAEEVAAALTNRPEIHVHRVWAELSTSRLLVMEHLEGTSLGKLGETVDATSLDHSKLADALLGAELEAMLSGQRFHADPHPGNVFLLPDRRLGLLDFGATGRLDTFERSSVISMLAALRDNDPTLLREAVLEVAHVSADIDLHLLDRSLAQFMTRHLGAGTSPDAAALSELLLVFGTHGIRLPATTATMFRALVTLEGTLTTLVPGYRVVDAAERLGQELVGEAVQAGPESIETELAKLFPLLQRAPRRLDRIATLLERGELKTRLSLFSDRKDMEVVSRLVNRLVLGGIGSAVGIASAMLLAVDAGPAVSSDVSLLDLLGFVGLASGAVLVLRVTLAALREDQNVVL